MEAGRTDYKPGETASVFVTNPFNEEAQALVTVERGVVMHHQVLRLPEVKATLASFSAEPVGNTPEEFAVIVGSEVAKFDRVVKAANIRLD